MLAIKQIHRWWINTIASRIVLVGLLHLCISQTPHANPREQPTQHRNGKRKDVAGALKFLQKQIGPIGLLDSFPADGQAHSYTYDNAIAALAFLAAGDP